MELKLKIGYAELFELIKQLPASQIFQLKSELAKSTLPAQKTEEDGLSDTSTQWPRHVGRTVSTIFANQILDEPMENQTLILIRAYCSASA